MIALASALLAGLLASSPVTVDPALPGAAEIERRVPAAIAAVEASLGEMDWRGVRVLAEPSNVIRSQSPVPEWAAAFALPHRGLVVLRPDRIGGYPYGTLEAVLTHELAHLAISRRAGTGDVPHWFEEGLAMSVASEMGPADMYHVSLALLFGPGASLDDLEPRFHGDAADAQAAYALSLSFVSYLEREAESDAPRRVLDEVAAGRSFAEAVRSVSGQTLGSLEAGWSHQVALFYRWLPLLTSTVTLWIAITLLVFVAYARKRRRVLEMRERWEREDGAAAEADEADEAPEDPDEPGNPNGADELGKRPAAATRLALDEVDTSGPHGPH